MSNLFKNLLNFKGCFNETDLLNEFRKLASAFLYGGYIDVNNQYKIYIKTVEFYFHSEKLDGIHDPIVYHRNGKCLDITPYFPLMTLHAHNSGYDITFENEKEQYRASALIRSYEIKNKNGKYLKWESNEKKFKFYDNYCYNKQSTYLYSLLNGFTLGINNSVQWIDSPLDIKYSITTKTRQGVYKSDNEYIYKPLLPKVKCNREWSFTREDKI